MSTIKVDTTKIVGKIKPMHGGGQPPLGGENMTEYFHYVTDAVEFDLKLPDGWIFDKYRVLSGIDGLAETNIDFSKKYRYQQKKLL